MGVPSGKGVWRAGAAVAPSVVRTSVYSAAALPLHYGCDTAIPLVATMASAS